MKIRPTPEDPANGDMKTLYQLDLANGTNKLDT